MAFPSGRRNRRGIGVGIEIDLLSARGRNYVNCFSTGWKMTKFLVKDLD